jgi:hypothetical protein
MRPRIHHLLSPAERALLLSWRRGVYAVFALLAAAIGYSLLTPHTRTVAEGGSRHEQAHVETCVQRTGALSDAMDRQMPGQVPAQRTNGRPRDC